MTTEQSGQSETQVKKTKLRSPAYPAIDLETAIARARELWTSEKLNTAPVSVILGHWGYAKVSSNGLVVLSALLKFGLLMDEGTGEKRKARLSELARRIILDDRPTSPERDAAIREAALNPTIHKEFWDTYKELLPSDDNLKYELKVNKHFTDSAAVNFIKELHSTWSFAKLAEYANMSAGGKDKTPLETESAMFSAQAQAVPVAAKESEPKSKAATMGTIKYCWPLSKNVMADVVITGSEISSKDLEMLRKYLELAKIALEDTP